jgi:uncharacterized surface protein with fasciclin (FAS1) repeats
MICPQHRQTFICTAQKFGRISQVLVILTTSVIDPGGNVVERATFDSQLDLHCLQRALTALTTCTLSDSTPFYIAPTPPIPIWRFAMKNVKRLALSLLLGTSLALTGGSVFAGNHADHSGHAKASKDIVDTAVAAGNFKTLAAALGAAGLVDTLKGAGPFTVFAPTDEAFAKLPAGTVENLLKPENKDKLTAILTYHVVAGSVKAADVVKLTSAKTVQGSSATIKVADGKVMVDQANVTATDIAASNGVIHVIDAVIMPK